MFLFLDNNVHGQIGPTFERRPSRSGRVYSPQPLSIVRPAASQTVKLKPFGQLHSSHSMRHEASSGFASHANQQQNRSASSPVSSHIQDAFQTLAIASAQSPPVSNTTVSLTSEGSPTGGLHSVHANSTIGKATKSTMNSSQPVTTESLTAQPQCAADAQITTDLRAELNSQTASNRARVFADRRIVRASSPINSLVHRSKSFNVTLDPQLRRYQGSMVTY